MSPISVSPELRRALNRDTSEWLAVFDDTLLAQSAVDRFKNNAYDLVIDGESYRARLKPTVDKDPPPPAAPVEKRSSAPTRDHDVADPRRRPAGRLRRARRPRPTLASQASVTRVSTRPHDLGDGWTHEGGEWQLMALPAFFALSRHASSQYFLG